MLVGAYSSGHAVYMKVSSTSFPIFHILLSILDSVFGIEYFRLSIVVLTFKCRRHQLFTWWPKSALTDRASRCHFVYYIHGRDGLEDYNDDA